MDIKKSHGDGTLNTLVIGQVATILQTQSKDVDCQGHEGWGSDPMHPSRPCLVSTPPTHLP